MKHIFYRTIAVSVFAVCIFSFSTQTTQAYNTTDQKTFELDKGSALFLIDYEFGHKNHEVQMPYLTQSTSRTANDTLSFSVLDKKGHEVAGKSSAIILSNTKFGNNGMYSVPKGFAKKFTLIVVFTPSASTTPDYHLQVTHLPFNFDGKQQLELNPSELQYYVTPYTDL